MTSLKNVSAFGGFFTAAMLAVVMTPLIGAPGYAQFAYEGMRQGIRYKIFVYAKEYLGNERWRFQTKAVYSTGSKPYFSEWRTADCENSTIDGEIIRAIPKYGYQEGEAAVLHAVCP